MWGTLEIQSASISGAESTADRLVEFDLDLEADFEKSGSRLFDRERGWCIESLFSGFVGTGILRLRSPRARDMLTPPDDGQRNSGFCRVKKSRTHLFESHLHPPLSPHQPSLSSPVPTYPPASASSIICEPHTCRPPSSSRETHMSRPSRP